MSMGSDTWVGKKPFRRLCGMSDALSIAADLGFAVPPPPTQEELQNLSTITGDKSDDLIRVLRELTIAEGKIADLQVELQGRKDDKNVAYLTHVSEMEKKCETLARITAILKDVIENKKCETLARITAILKDVIENKDRIIARLQQPYSLDCIPVEAEYQKEFSELLLKAASDYGALTASVTDFQWNQNFREPPTAWGEMLRPIPVALASCTRYFEAMSATRSTFTTLQNLREGHSPYSMSATPTPTNVRSQGKSGDSDYMTPPQRKDLNLDAMVMNAWTSRVMESESGELEDDDSLSQKSLSWPSVKKIGLSLIEGFHSFHPISLLTLLSDQF
ncbi:Augmin subunit [Thalictrum thalictroides]|uniref:Augmin subunit n=1 Tax=Thalictrum thalictroides TaxID=46969 RepID=A0A7J6V1G0_THATH|nr:Augmin subunit [Thalictrum thalictroides]